MAFVTDDFESGLGQWTVTGSPTVVTSHYVAGGHGLKIDTSSGSAQQIKANPDPAFPGTNNWNYVSFGLFIPSWSVRWDSGTGWDPYLLSFSPVASFSAAAFYIQPQSSSTGTIEFNFGGGSFADSPLVPDNQWVSVIIAYKYRSSGNFSDMQYWINGSASSVFTSPGGAGFAVDGLEFGDDGSSGSTGGVDISYYIDKISFSSSMPSNVDLTGAFPSGGGGGTYTDAGTVNLKLTPSSSEIYQPHSFSVHVIGDRTVGSTLTAITDYPSTDPSLTPPSLINTTFSGSTVTLTYDMPLTVNTPTASQFTVTYDDPIVVSVTSVAVSGATVVLTLASSISSFDLVQVSYSAAGATKIRNSANVAAAAFSAMNAFNTVTSGDLWMVQITRRNVLINTYAGENLELILNKQPPHTAQWEISHSHPGVAHDFIRPKYHDFLIMYGNTPIMAGPVTDFSVTGSDEFSGFAGRDWSDRLDIRHYPFDPNSPHPPAAFPGSTADFAIGSPPSELVYQAPATDVAEIIRTLLDVVFSRPNSLGLLYPTLTTNLGIPTDFDLSVADTTTMKQIIDNLSGIYPGFQWEVLWTKEIRLYSPNKYGSNVIPASTSAPDIAAAAANCNFALINDPAVLDVRFANTGPAATHFLGTGSGLANNRLGSAIIGTTEADVDTAYGRIDGSEDFGDEPNRATVVDRTQKILAKALNPQHEISVEVDPDSITDFWILASPGSAIWLDQDLISHRIQSPQEIIRMEVKPDPEGNTTVTMDLEQIYASDTGFSGTEQG